MTQSSKPISKSLFYRYLHMYAKLIYKICTIAVSNRKNGTNLKLLENDLNKL